MRLLLAAIAVVALPNAALSGADLIDVDALDKRIVHEIAELTPLAIAEDGTPAVVFLDVKAGDVIPPHAAMGSLRILTVVSGELSWGDGSQIDEAKERVFPAGSVLTVPAGIDHWVAARSGPIRLQLVVLDDEAPAPGIKDQMQ
ncbi:MAG: cupin domain-containing protein [Pseudomonadota bacterium]